VSWEVRPQVEEDAERALLAAVSRALDEEDPADSDWWRSGLEDLGGGPAPQQSWRDPGIVEP
jgi:hypothetical protein